jgi:hypothetical protein
VKKNLILILMFLVSSEALADGGDSSKGRFVLGLSLGVATPLDGFASSAGVAYAGQFTFGYAVDDNLSFFLASQSCIFQTGVLGVGLTQFDLVPTVKVAIGDKAIKPYVTVGSGLHVTNSHFPNAEVLYSALSLQGGVGLQFPLNKKVDFFVEGKYTHVFTSFTLSYLPLRAGVNFDL